MQDLLLFQPLYQERVWGGKALAAALGRTLPSGGPIGESWEIVDRPEAQSQVVGGTWAGKTLRELIAEAGAKVMGPGWPAGKAFPILVKWLDCRERLSLQVHPPAAVAGELRGEPKTENWYLAEAAAGAELIVGLRRGRDARRFRNGNRPPNLETCVHRFPVQAGDSILVRSGQVHAIGAGNLILEIQQNSDTTYRVYDWGRVGLDGKPRQMHVAQSLRSIDWQDFEPEPVRGAAVSTILADCAEFRIRRVVLNAGETWRIAPRQEARLVSVVAGAVAVRGGAGGSAEQRLARGTNALVPFAGACEFEAEQATTLLVTEAFSRI